ncbi:MAG: replication factor C large subunit [Candidatus Aenigmarchaeota archaeon]|nr:replication factor C large subunit [Candidatus Aenigmarchaeota archaeon]
MWTQKYQPKNTKEIVGQEKAKESFLKWIKNWKSGGKAALIYGPNGVGKTSLVYAYAKENGLDVIELNASDYRTAQKIDEVIGASVKQQSLFKKGKIFLIDEIDGLSSEDKGGTNEIVKIIKESNYPIIFIANDPWDKKISKIKENCVEIPFSSLTYWDILKVLKNICEKEGIKHDDEILKYIAKISEGDLRAAINDLEKISVGKKEISKKDIVYISLREKESNVFDALKIIFKSKSALSSKSSIENTDKDLKEVFWWIEQNIVNEYEKKEEIAESYEMLSLADLYLRRAETKRSYKLMKYFIDFMTIGVSLAKKQEYKKFVKYEYPENIKYLGITKVERKDDKEMIENLAKELHCSTRKIKTQYLPYLKFLSRNNK